MSEYAALKKSLIHYNYGHADVMRFISLVEREFEKLDMDITILSSFIEENSFRLKNTLSNDDHLLAGQCDSILEEYRIRKTLKERK